MSNKRNRMVFMTILYTLFLFSMDASASIQGKFSEAVGGDKAAHAIVGLASTVLTYTFTDLTIGQSFAVGVGVGILKEVADTRKSGTGFDGYDVMFTGAGAFVGGFAVEHLEQIGVGVKYKWRF